MSEILDKLYIELATVVSPETKTGREIRLERKISDLEDALLERRLLLERAQKVCIRNSALTGDELYTLAQDIQKALGK